MIHIPMNTKGAFDRNTLAAVNDPLTQGAKDAQNIASLNCPPKSGAASRPGRPAAPPPPASPTPGEPAPPEPMQMRLPPLLHPVRKGQKTALSPNGPLGAIHACFGWNASNPRCDVDVSAFLLDGNGKALGDSWFVFYGQTASPDQSAVFHETHAGDREMISVRFQKLHPSVKKIVFVLTIHEALERKLNFSMMKDCYVRLLGDDGKTELISFRMEDYYSNVISMMIGEVYLHNGTWKFHAVGNGVARDLAGLCALYGVEVSG